MGNGKSFFCLPKDQCTIGPSENIVPPEGLNIFCIPLKLDAQPRFLYSLGFIIWPWVYYFMEFLQSDDFKNMHKEMIDIWFDGSTPVWKALFRTMFMMMSSIYHIVLWPVVMHWRKFISEAKYLTSQGEERVKARIKRDDATIVSSRLIQNLQHHCQP